MRRPGPTLTDPPAGGGAALPFVAGVEVGEGTATRSVAWERPGDWRAARSSAGPQAAPEDSFSGVRRAVDRPRADAADVLAAAITATLDLDLETMGAFELRRLARTTTRELSRLEGLRARITAAADRSGVVDADGASSSAAWLAETTGGTARAAASAVSLGRAMDVVPSLADAVSSGRVGGEQATSIARAADRGVLAPEHLDQLVDEAATMPAGPFARNLRAIEARTDQRRLRQGENLARERRRADWRWSDDGTMFEGSFRLPVVAGRTVETALRALTRPDPADTPDDVRRSPTQRRADALEQLARLTLERGDTSQVRAVKPHVTVTVPVTMLDVGTREAPDTAAAAAGAVGTLPDGTIISAETTRRLLCDATVRRLVLDPAGSPLEVGRATRAWSGAQRAALAAVDGGCRGPACDRPFEWTDIHHITWWRQRGRTDIDNGAPLCGRCHDLVHHAGWSLSLDRASRMITWTSPTGRTTTTHPRGPAAVRRR